MSQGPSILSVDVEALVRKRAAYSFRSPHHYPVELVRDAARRGASTVQISLSPNSLKLRDDGTPHSDATMNALAVLLDPDAAVSARVEAIEGFEAWRGLGLLAAMAPGPSRLRIQRSGAAPGGLEYRRGLPPTLVQGPYDANLLVMERKGNAREEGEVLREWCRWSPMDIHLDGETIAGGPPAGHLGLTRLGDDASGGDTLWLPVRGEACRVRLLDHGIQWKLAAYGPDHGLLYEAAVESPEQPPKQLRSRLRSVALDLYSRRIQGRTGLSRSARDRLDELVFLHHRRTGSDHLMGSYEPFELAGRAGLLGLDAIRDQAAKGPVQALPVDANLERFDVEDRDVLLLTPRQWEYLEDHAGVPLAPPPARPRRRGLAGRLLGEVGGAVRRGLDAALRQAERPVAPQDMSPAERTLVDHLTAALQEGRCILPGLEGRKDLQVLVLAGSPWRPPARIRKGQILLNRNSRDLQRAAGAAARDPDLLQVAVPLLFNGHDGWI